MFKRIKKKIWYLNFKISIIKNLYFENERFKSNLMIFDICTSKFFENKNLWFEIKIEKKRINLNI